MHRTPITSQSLASVGYDAARATLEIEFHSGHVYRYYGVPPWVHQELMQADSRGRYFIAHIRNRYRFARLPPSPARKAPPPSGPGVPPTR